MSALVCCLFSAVRHTRPFAVTCSPNLQLLARINTYKSNNLCIASSIHLFIYRRPFLFHYYFVCVPLHLFEWFNDICRSFNFHINLFFLFFSLISGLGLCRQCHEYIRSVCDNRAMRNDKFYLNKNKWRMSSNKQVQALNAASFKECKRVCVHLKWIHNSKFSSFSTLFYDQNFSFCAHFEYTILRSV